MAVLAVIAAMTAQRVPAATAADLPEYRLKAAFLYNFAVFTDWPPQIGPVLNLCVIGKDPFGPELDPLQGKKVGERTLNLHRAADADELGSCQIIFITTAALPRAPQTLDKLRGLPVLTVTDGSAPADLGITLSLHIVEQKISFDANIAAARSSGIKLSSQLLKLAREVRQ